MKRSIIDNLKNIPGWKTPRKIVVFSVDDYGNVRLDSKQAREKMNGAGLKIFSRFDAYDTLETREDLEILFDVLSSVKDQMGNHAVFTPFAVPCNIDFEKLSDDQYSGYQYELLPVTYEKLAAKSPKAYEGAWNLWKNGLANGLLVPQFHGREYLSLKVFEEKLAAHDPEVMTCLKNRSYTSITDSGYPTISYTAAFDFWELEENERFAEIIKDGLDAFEKVFGYRSVHFTPPGGRDNHVLHEHLIKGGVKYTDMPLISSEHQGKGKYKRRINHTGRKSQTGMIACVRNVVFEPTQSTDFEWVHFSLQQIEAAFRWHRPAIISSHRVNFCGHIAPENRKQGIAALRSLLIEIVARWPEVEFISSGKLVGMIGSG